MSYNNHDDYNDNGKKSTDKLSLRSTVSVLGAIAATLVSLVLVTMVGCEIGFHNPSTPAGYWGYVVKGAVAGKSEFVEVEEGPSSTGAHWMYRLVKVPKNPLTYTEWFEGKEQIQAGNTYLDLSLNCEWRVRPNKDAVRQFVEKQTTLTPGDNEEQIAQTAYDNYIKQPLRTAVRAEVEKIGAMQVKDHQQQIADDLTVKMQEITKGTPFEIMHITLGSLHYPDSVTDQVASSIAAQQRLAQKDTEIAIENAKADKRVQEAEGLAEAADIIHGSITDRWLKHEAIKAQTETVNGPNSTTMIVPVGVLGAPVTGGGGK